MSLKDALTFHYLLHSKNVVTRVSAGMETGLILTRVIDDWRRIMPENSLDALFIELISVWFSNESITFLVNRYNHRFTQILRNFSLPQFGPTILVNAGVNGSPPSMKKNGDGLFDSVPADCPE